MYVVTMNIVDMQSLEIESIVSKFKGRKTYSILHNHYVPIKPSYPGSVGPSGARTND